MPPVASLYDTGVWVARSFSSHPFHTKTRAIFEQADSGRPAAWSPAGTPFYRHRVPQIAPVTLL